MEEAIAFGYQPEDLFEWLTYIEAQALTGSIEDAYQLSLDVFADDKRIREGLCQLWKRVQAQISARTVTEVPINEILLEFECVR
jgi:hypothetical protein